MIPSLVQTIVCRRIEWLTLGSDGFLHPNPALLGEVVYRLILAREEVVLWDPKVLDCACTVKEGALESTHCNDIYARLQCVLISSENDYVRRVPVTGSMVRICVSPL